MGTTQYIDRFLNLNCINDLLPFFLKSNHPAKEISESFAVYNIAQQLPQYQDDQFANTTIFVIGDGNTPRTGALFAYLSKADVISIDPTFNWEFWLSIKDKTRRLLCLKERYENVKLETLNIRVNILIVSPHAHVYADRILSKYIANGNRSMIVIPCCCQAIQLPTIGGDPDFKYTDESIFSEKNEIYMWKSI
jgi:hypothetical protein